MHEISEPNEYDARLASLSVSGDLMALVLDYLESENAADATLASRARLQGQVRLTFAQWWQWLDDLQAAYPYTSVALELAKRVAPEHLGVIGYLTLAAGSVLEAFQHFERYQRLLYEGPAVRLEMREGMAGLVWDTAYGGSSKHSDCVIHGGLITFLRRMTGRAELNLIRTDVIWADVPDCEAYLAHTGGTMNTSASANAVWFPAEVLMLPLVQAHGGVVERLQEAASQALQSLPDADGVVAAVRRLLVSGLPQGKGDQVAVARQLAMSERTLLRRLRDSGVSFRALQTAVRMELAQRYLRDRHLTLSEIALLLGYSEQAAFSRAFKTALGLPPGEWQRRHASMNR